MQVGLSVAVALWYCTWDRDAHLVETAELRMEENTGKEFVCVCVCRGGRGAECLITVM